MMCASKGSGAPQSRTGTGSRRASANGGIGAHCVEGFFFFLFFFACPPHMPHVNPRVATRQSANHTSGNVGGYDSLFASEIQKGLCRAFPASSCQTKSGQAFEYSSSIIRRDPTLTEDATAD
jgi:hypothetical protein